MANLNSIFFSCEKLFQYLDTAPAKMLYLTFTSSQKCQCSTGIQLSWKDRHTDRAISPHVYCIALKTFPQHDLCNLLCISLPCNSVISTLCGACHAVMPETPLGALAFAVLPASTPSSTLHTIAKVRKAAGWGA